MAYTVANSAVWQYSAL